MSVRARVIVTCLVVLAGALVVPVVGAAPAQATTTVLSASQAGLPWTADDATSGTAVLSTPNVGCPSVDADGYCSGGAWPLIGGAHWIWRTASVTPDEAVSGTPWVTFTDTFSAPGTGDGVTTLSIAADDEYVVTLNGSEIASGAMTIGTYPVAPVGGTNTLVVKVRSLPSSLTPYETPAGVAWRLSTTWDSTVTLAASPRSVVFGTIITLTASLTTGSPVRTVSIYRTPLGGAESLVASGAMPAGVNFTVSLIPAVTTTYVARYSGDGAWPAAESVPVTVTVSSISLTASQESVAYGTPVTLSVALFTGASDRTVSLYGTPAGGSQQLLTSDEPDAEGHVTFTAYPSKTTTYVARSPGDGVWPSLGSAAVQVQVYGWVSLSASRSIVAPGKPVTITVSLSTGAASRRVVLRAATSTNASRLVASTVLPPGQTWRVVLTPKVTTRYWAGWLGDVGWRGAWSPEVRVGVTLVWTARNAGGYASAGAYRLYHWSARCRPPAYAGCPVRVFTTVPSHRGERVKVEFQWLSRRGWQPSSTYRWMLDRHGSVTSFSWYTTRGVIGVGARARATFLGDDDHVLTVSRWIYWRVTR